MRGRLRCCTLSRIQLSSLTLVFHYLFVNFVLSLDHIEIEFLHILHLLQAKNLIPLLLRHLIHQLGMVYDLLEIKLTRLQSLAHKHLICDSLCSFKSRINVVCFKCFYRLQYRFLLRRSSLMIDLCTAWMHSFDHLKLLTVLSLNLHGSLTLELFVRPYLIERLWSLRWRGTCQPFSSIVLLVSRSLLILI